jgi:hypothetical protein
MNTRQSEGQMVMNRDERLRFKKLLEIMQESDSPTMGNTAVFLDEQGTILYAGIISEWPMLVSVDIEWGKVEERDATKEPFAGKKVKFFSPFVGN